MSIWIKTSLLGTPWDNSKISERHPPLKAAHRAMVVGPAAPATTASRATTTTLCEGCRRFMVERGSRWCLRLTNSLFHKSQAAILGSGLG